VTGAWALVVRAMGRLSARRKRGRRNRAVIGVFDRALSLDPVAPVDRSRNIRHMTDLHHRREMPRRLHLGRRVIPMVRIEPSLLLDESEFRRRMGWTADRLEAEEARGRVFHLVVDQAARYPAFYAEFDPAGRRRLAAVCRLLGDLPGGSKWQFFTGGKGSLSGSTPLAALRAGRLRQVKAAAEGFIER